MKQVCLKLALVLALAIAPRAHAQQIKEVKSLQEPFGITALAVSPDGKAIAWADKDNQILWRPADGSRRIAIGKHAAVIRSLAFSADGKKVAAFSTDKMVQVWAVGTETVIAKHKVETPSGLLAFGPGDKVVLAYAAHWTENGMDHAEIRLLDVESAKLRTLAKASTAVGIPGSPANYELLAFSRDGETLAFNKAYISGYFPGLMDIAGKKTLKMPEGVQFDIDTRLALPGGAAAVLVVRNGQIKLCDPATGKTLSSGKGPSNATLIAANGGALVTVDAKNTVTTYEIAVTPKQFPPVNSKVNPDRVKGMKDALADIEKGLLRVKSVPPPAPPWYGEYLDLLKKECGIEIVHTDRGNSKLEAEMDGYNALMLLEIEHRFGPDILGRVGKKAADDYSGTRNGN